MTTVDGMSYDQVKHNVYAFGLDVRKYQRKADRARKDSTRRAYIKRRDEYSRYLADNQDRLAKFPPMSVYEFHVADDDGFWGGIRVAAESPQEAAMICRKQLEDNEIEPNGSLSAEFGLTLAKCDGKEYVER